MRLDASKRMNVIAEENIAHGALTNSKRPSCFVKGVYPTHIQSGYKCYLRDVDGNEYIDYICGLGTNLFGYANPDIRRAVEQSLLSGGSAFSLSSKDEVTFADRFVDEFPFIEKVRFLKSGSEGCAAAVRIARAYTGRFPVFSYGYHGWTDEFTALTPPAEGCPPANYMRGILLEGEDDFGGPPPAAVILEPVITDNSKEHIEKLKKIRESCDKHGIVLIYDETITAYRYKEGSVAKCYNILPDLWVAGKAIAGGLPLSVVGGRADIMESDYFVSSTWAGDRLAIAAASKSIDLIHSDFEPNQLWEYGGEFLRKFNDIDRCVQIEGYPTRGVFKYASEMWKHLFMQGMCESGVLIGPSWFYNKWLHAEMDNVIGIAKGVIKKLKENGIQPRGESPVSPFAERVRNAR